MWELTLTDDRGQRERDRPTGLHKFYSQSRGEWVSACDLQPGEQLGGLRRPLTVTRVQRVPGVHRVYNMTVEGEHVYHVSSLAVVAHNNECGPTKTFAEQMTPSEAARYQEYWQRYAPQQVEPGTQRLDWIRQSGRTGRMESSRVIYDEFGRQRFRVDFSDHMRPNVHSNPHLHEFLYGPGFSNTGRESVFNFPQ